ncbi:hypothetical protein HMPREF0063_12025 [Aeromicrobium marinum DSM 15272]|uniref:Deoxyribodipyrimidine photolyase-related protein n=1 Tax=Aeromicrobium marinum DSM 15272 TaxID=585531 RepID=E2SE89_9ACTN|nr:cryptochrome/photolyase family protein [Aeromicrobium marinum]EFQ82816.1 hypothetical protein HMPREF0063_12025 [Aeromicrobium marinum DSM 15272]
MARVIFGDQLGPHFDDGGDLLLVDATASWRDRPIHRQKAHLLLTALRRRAAELGERAAIVTAADLPRLLTDRDDIEVVAPTSWAERDLVGEHGATVLPSRGFVTDEATFAAWADGRDASRLVMEHFYRDVRTRERILMNGPDDPEGGRWNYDHDNREPPPRGQATLGLPASWAPTEDDVDEAVRRDLDAMEAEGVQFLGRDGPRWFAATRDEALAALDDFVRHRLPAFGPHEDAMLAADPVMAHSRLSVPLNLGLLDPREVVAAALAAFDAGDAPLAGVEGFVRQVVGWRDWVWHLYWYLGRDYATSHDHLGAGEPLPSAWWALDGDGVESACLSHVLRRVGDTGWAHHIERLMVLGNFSLQRGHDPVELNRWFTDAFVDGTPWVMPANVIGMSQHADGGLVATKPYAAGGAYVNRMSDHCGGCTFDPRKRLGDDACPYTAGYWAFLHRVEPFIRGNHRMAQPLAGMRRLADIDAVVEAEVQRERW